MIEFYWIVVSYKNYHVVDLIRKKLSRNEEKGGKKDKILTLFGCVEEFATQKNVDRLSFDNSATWCCDIELLLDHAWLCLVTRLKSFKII